MIVAFKGVLIGLELEENLTEYAFDFPALTKSPFGKNQSY